MLWDGRTSKLVARHFLVNIALPENTLGGLTVIQRDPRKQRIKPACYVGVVEEVADSCLLVKPGDKVVFERWEWQQQNIDDQRLIARERDLMVLDGSKLPPNMILLELIQAKSQKSSLFIPDTVRVERQTYYQGKVLMTTAHPSLGEVGEEVFVESYDEGQYRDDRGRLFFRTDRVALVMLRLKRMPVPELTVV